MEIGVKAWVENFLADSCRHVSSAYLTFVAVDKEGKHAAVPPVIPETDEQKRRDRKSTRLNSSHLVISYAVFCLKKKNTCSACLPVEAARHRSRKASRHTPAPE